MPDAPATIFFVSALADGFYLTLNVYLYILYNIHVTFVRIYSRDVARAGTQGTSD